MRRLGCFTGIILGWLAAPAVAGDAPVSFRHEVMAILSRGGCNQGTCHGNLHGKGGFKLSLRGEDPDKDWAALTRDQAGRRLNLHDPDASLVQQKATARVPHEGGQRFAVGSSEYKMLLRWIVSGAGADPPERIRLQRLIAEPAEAFLLEPTREVRVRAWAVFADGSKKDVSNLAVFESSNVKIEASRDGVIRSDLPGETTIAVRYLHQQATSILAFVPARRGFAWSNPPAQNYIDELVFARLKKLRVNPSELCSDSEFLRRAYLDLAGFVPPPEETRRFLADARPDKRARLIEALLVR